LKQGKTRNAVFFTVKSIFSTIKLWPLKTWPHILRGSNQRMKKLGVLARVLVVVGALNWGLVGLFHFDLVATLVGRHFGETSPISSAIYILVALAGVYEAASWKTVQRQSQNSYSPARG
jgi:uncharacterized protein